MQNKPKNNITNMLIIIAISVMTITILASGILYFVSKDFFTKIFPVFLVITMLATIMLFYLMLKYFQSIKTFDHYAHLLSQGTLNIDDIMLSDVRGLEMMAIAFNDMKTNLLSFTELTKTNVITISDAIDKVTESIDMSYKGNEQIANSVGKVAEKAAEQLESVKATIAKIEEVTARTENIATSIGNIKKSIVTTVEMTNTGTNHLNQYNDKMQIISGNLSETSTFIAELNSHLNEIGQVSGFIIKITEQLKMLALNASVEAARAGEVGKGFAVVADEMNNLSTATRHNIGRIDQVLSSVTESSEKVSSSIDSCVVGYNESKESFQAIKESFGTINESANHLRGDIEKVVSEVVQINKNNQDIRDKGNVLVNASSEISSKSQEVAAVTEEELAENEQVSNQTSALKNMLSGIEKLLTRFKTSVAPANTKSTKHLKLIFLSPLDHEFWHGVRRGVLYAQKELKEKNTSVEYYGFVQDSVNQMMKTFREKLDQGCDGFVVPGFTSDFIPLIEKAHSKGIPTMVFNCQLPEASKSMAYFGPDVNGAGTLAANLMVKSLDGSGKVAIFRGGMNVSSHKIRTLTIQEALKSKRKINVAYEVEASDNDDIVYNAVRKVLQQDQGVQGIFITGGGVPGAARAIEELNLVGKTKIVCFDYDQTIFELIKKGIIYAAIGQDPFGQGHDPIVYLYNYLVTKVKPENDIIWTRTEVVDNHNVNDLL